MRRLREPGAKLLDQPRFAEARLADDQRELPLAAARALPAAREDVEFLGAADQRRRRARAAAPAAAAGAHDAVELRLFGHAFQFMLALVLGDEQARDLPVHAARDPDFSGRGGALHARGDVGRLAVHLAGRIDHDPPALEPDAGGKLRRAGRGVARVEVGERALDRERRAHGALAVVLLRLGIAEQRHQPVAELLQHMAAERSHGGRGGVEVTPHQIAPVLGIELRREARRADEVAKHHRDRTALGDISRRCRRRGDRWLRRSLCRAEICNRLEQALAVTEWYANLFEVAVRQFRQNFSVDFIFAEQRLVLAETEASQPIPDVHDRSSIGCRRSWSR